MKGSSKRGEQAHGRDRKRGKQVGGGGRLISETGGSKGIWIWDPVVKDNGSPLLSPLLLTEGHISDGGQICIRVWAA